MNLERKENRKFKNLLFFKLQLFSFLFLSLSFQTVSQDSIPEAKDLTEDKELAFQEFFFKAISEKAIENHKKAIENLESCNQILSNDKTVLFEFSKNYLALDNTLLAKEYLLLALQQDVTNVWMLKHFVAIHVKDANYTAAIAVQKKIVRQKPRERTDLITLYLQNRDTTKAIDLLNVLETEQVSSEALIKLKEEIERSQKQINSSVLDVSIDTFNAVEKFKTDKSYVLLKDIFISFRNDPVQLLKYSAEGIALFPAQPLVYLEHGKALNAMQEFAKAILVLKNGIDFVIDDAMEVNFYNEIANSYNGLGNTLEEKRYKEKSKKIKL